MGQGKQYQIGSFNARQLSRSTSTRIKAAMIAKLIRHEQMDLIGMQEVLDADALIPIMAVLGTDWDKVWLCSRPKPGIKDPDHDPRGEGYAFIWNKRRLRLIQTNLLSGEKEPYEPQVYNEYRVDFKQELMELVRDPVYGRFTVSGLGGGNFELRILMDHIRFNGIDEEKDRRFWKLRQNEFDVLTKSILPKLEDMTYGTQMPSYTILMGDYNMNLRRFWTKKPFLETPQDGLALGDKKIVTVQDQPTKLRSPNYKKPNEPTVGYLHNFDHFSYNINRLSALHPACRRVDVMGTGYYSEYYGDYDRYRLEISDHIPIILTISP
ncbi:MAG: hypothetical protein IJ899_02595 [Blautia sp.]|nr:hypothetical protein [Blautia sp.]